MRTKRIFFKCLFQIRREDHCHKHDNNEEVFFFKIMITERTLFKTLSLKSEKGFLKLLIHVTKNKNSVNFFPRNTYWNQKWNGIYLTRLCKRIVEKGRNINATMVRNVWRKMNIHITWHESYLSLALDNRNIYKQTTVGHKPIYYRS